MSKSSKFSLNKNALCVNILETSVLKKTDLPREVSYNNSDTNVNRILHN